MVATSPGTVQLLLKTGANVNIVGFDLRTAQHHASERRDQRIVQLLVEDGANVNAVAYSWSSALLAAEMGNMDVVLYLIHYGADINSPDYHERTLLHWAAKHVSDTIVRALAAKGTNLDASDRWGRTPLMWAIECMEDAVALLLLALGAKIDTKTQNDARALHVAAFAGCEAVIRQLLKMGADMDMEARCWQDDGEEEVDLEVSTTKDMSFHHFLRKRWSVVRVVASAATGTKKRQPGLTVRQLAILRGMLQYKCF
jgi:ankyrin repeat protein